MAPILHTIHTRSYSEQKQRSFDKSTSESCWDRYESETHRLLKGFRYLKIIFITINIDCLLNMQSLDNSANDPLLLDSKTEQTSPISWRACKRLWQPRRRTSSRTYLSLSGLNHRLSHTLRNRTSDFLDNHNPLSGGGRGMHLVP